MSFPLRHCKPVIILLGSLLTASALTAQKAMLEDHSGYSFNSAKLVPGILEEPARYNSNYKTVPPPGTPEEPSKYSFNYSKVVPGMPENASLGAYGNVSLNTGKGLPNISFDLYTFSKGGVNVPISISYEASGIKYNDVPSAVGMKWNLNAGGSINRSVNGIVDEDYLVDHMEFLDVAGMEYRNLHLMGIDQQDSAKRVAKGQFDVSLDNYYYNLPGHSGSMYLGKNKTFRPDKEYTHLQISYTNHFDAFQIKDDVGNTYLFSDYNDNSTVYNTGHYNKQALSSFSARVAWKLSKITTATGQEINFEYMPYIYDYMTLDSERWTSYISGAGTPYATCGGVNGDYMIGTSEAAYTTNHFINSARLLSRIYTDDQEVLFSYTDNAAEPVFKRQLAAIKVYSKISGDTIKRFQFTHSGHDLTGFSEADRLTNSPVKTHNFEYAAGYGSFVDAYDKKRDIFGYYNGANNTTLISNPGAVTFGYPFALADRHINDVVISHGVLNKITYPTGGSTRFAYEYNHESVTGGEFYAPGVRVKSIFDTDGAGKIINTKHFYYSGLVGGVGYADMTLVNEPSSNLEPTMNGVWYSDRIDDNLTGAFYYQQVITENVGDAGPGIPKLYEADFYTSQPELYQVISPLLIKKNIYLADMLHLQKSTEYTYDQVFVDSVRIVNYTLRKAIPRYGPFYYENDPSVNTGCPPVTLYQGYDSKYALQPILYNLHTVVTKEYPTTGDSMITTVQNQYYSNPVYMQQSDQTIYSGKSTSVRYTYPFNYTIGTPASMAASFIISPVITEEYLVNNTSKTKKENLYTYNSNGFYVPQQQKITDITSNTYKTFEFYDYNNKGHILSQGQTLNTKTSYIYDYLNELPIAEVVNADNASIAFTSFEADGKGNWSFTGTPAADANALTGGKTYALSLSSLSKSGLNTATTYTVSYWSKGAAGSITGTLTGWPKIVNTATVNGQAWTCYEHLVTGQSTITLAGSNIIDEVSLHPRMTLMTTYTYRPLTGISSSSNSNYRITYYDYDGMGRLEYVRDDKGAILKKIGYNYAGPIDNTQVFYNGAQSQSFARNDCTGGMVGSSVTYKVAAGAYISSISQAYVDSLALAEIATNGPAYALVNSTCIVPCDTRGCRLLEGSKCVNNICEAGQKIYTSSVFDQMTGKFTCTYHYKWSDNSVSADYTEQNSFGCPGF